MNRRSFSLTAIIFSVAATVAAQTPQPFPGVPSQPRPPQPAPQTPPVAPSGRPASPEASAPTAAALGLPIYPSAQFIASYDAGRGQRYYIFGATASFAELVAYYRTQLKDRGDLVFEEPPTHMFETGRYHEDTMAFPPGVTLKDWTDAGS